MAVLPYERGPDIEQGKFFHDLLAARREELCDLLDTQAVTLARCEGTRDTAGVRRKRQRIKQIGAEIREVDRMMHALQHRLLNA